MGKEKFYTKGNAKIPNENSDSRGLTNGIGVAIIISLVLFSVACSEAPQNEISISSSGDLEGVWDRRVRTSNIYQYLGDQGIEIPFTELGANRFRNVNFAENPNGYCWPPGPSRMITGPQPFQIVQGGDVIAILNENHGVYRIVHMDRENFPSEMLEYSQFMGHSFGSWEDDVLVVETVSIRGETWLDSNGLLHSENLQLVETFERTDPNTMRYTVTYNDPEYYARPFTLEADYILQDTVILEYVCTENENDLEMLQPTFPNRDLDIRVYSGSE